MVPLLKEAVEVCGHGNNKAVFQYMKDRWPELHPAIDFPLAKVSQVSSQLSVKNRYADINKKNKVSKKCPETRRLRKEESTMTTIGEDV